MERRRGKEEEEEEKEEEKEAVLRGQKTDRHLKRERRKSKQEVTNK